MNQWPLPKRQDFARQLQNSQASGKHQLEFQGVGTYFDVYIVDIEFPCYRLSNGRTRSSQQELIAKDRLPENFFSADPDSAPAIEAQHKILTRMVTIGADSEILKILRNHPQTQPLILDSEGYMINGNRRLCAMRLLVEEDPEEYDRFRHIQVIFLPPCTLDDIDEIEAKLQWLPEGRSEYSWVDKAMMLRERQSRGWSMMKLCDLYEMGKGDIQKDIAMLEDAEVYLEERGWHGEYSRVLRNELAFDKLQKGRAKCGDDESKKEFFTRVAYLMLDDPDATGRRLYESIPDALKFSDNVADQMRLEFSDRLPSPGSDSDNNLDILGGDGESEYTDVATLVRQPENFEKAREVVRDKLEEMRTLTRERKDATYCLRELQKAYTALQNARNNFGSDKETNGMVSYIDNIESACNDLRTLLNNA